MPSTAASRTRMLSSPDAVRDMAISRRHLCWKTTGGTEQPTRSDESIRACDLRQRASTTERTMETDVMPCFTGKCNVYVVRGQSNRRASCRTAARVRSREVFDCASMASNVGRASTSANSASNTGLLMSVSEPSRTRSSRMCSVPCQSSPDSSTLVSMIARTLFALGARGLYFCADLVHRHRCNASGRHAVGD